MVPTIMACRIQACLLGIALADYSYESVCRSGVYVKKESSDYAPH